jgi:hypothetical protein
MGRGRKYLWMELELDHRAGCGGDVIGEESQITVVIGDLNDLDGDAAGGSGARVRGAAGLDCGGRLGGISSCCAGGTRRAIAASVLGEGAGGEEGGGDEAGEQHFDLIYRIEKWLGSECKGIMRLALCRSMKSGLAVEVKINSKREGRKRERVQWKKTFWNVERM